MELTEGTLRDFSGRARLQCSVQEKAPDELTAQFAHVQIQPSGRSPRRSCNFTTRQWDEEEN